MSIVARFRVATRATGHRREVEVLVYDDREQMARAHCDHRGIEYQPDDDIGGGLAFRGGWWWPTPDPYPIVVMRLWTGQLSNRTVAHEATHAASLFFFTDYVKGWESRARSYLMGDHEPLAYAIGDITSEVVRMLYKKRLLG